MRILNWRSELEHMKMKKKTVNEGNELEGWIWTYENGKKNNECCELEEWTWIHENERAFPIEKIKAGTCSKKNKRVWTCSKKTNH